jgi:hypothetical protein
MGRIIESRLTGVDEAYATCERTCARLHIYSGEVPPEQISLRLSLQPTSVVNKGLVTTNSLGRSRVGKSNGWFLSSEEHVESRDLRHHLDWLLERLRVRAEVLRELQDEEELTMAVSCIWWSKYGDGGPVLWPEQMKHLAELNLECGFELAFYGAQED